MWLNYDISIERLIELDADRQVAHVRVGPLHIKSIWIVGIAEGKPRTTWPETGKGYPIVEADEPLKTQIDELILAAVTESTQPELFPNAALDEGGA